ncbi:MAG TPA: hypothetical protein VHW09_24100 [Bryobacteraceae bacterium]|jgi:hypothetical protein|nr:hypothetical protein [Bryobacteraceae bacterium]
MRQPVDAYREGYDKARTDNLGGVTGEVLMGILRDDPGRYFERGYHDGRAGKPFSPPIEVREPPAAENRFSKKTAVKTNCPNCGVLDWFEWKFLGRLTDPVCGYTWFAGSGTYAWMQLRASLLSGAETARYFTSELSGQSEIMASVFKGLGWLLGAVLGTFIRLEVGLPMVPIQAVVGLCHDRDKKHPGRYIALVLSGIAAIVITYAIRHNPSGQYATGQQRAATIRPMVSTVSSALPASGARAALTPTFDTIFDEAYSNQWSYTVGEGAPRINWSKGDLRIQAPVSGSSIIFLSNQQFSGDIDADFRFNHQGFGRTTVGIYCASARQWLAEADLDTNDTAYLGLGSGGRSSGYAYSSAPYLNTLITIRIIINGDHARVYANNELMVSYPFTPVVPYQLGLAVNSVSWKSGDNITDFYRVTAECVPPQCWMAH